MEERQHGIASSELVNVLPNNSMYKEIVEDAYEVPLKDTEKGIQNSISDFSQDVYNFCEEEILK